MIGCARFAAGTTAGGWSAAAGSAPRIVRYRGEGAIALVCYGDATAARPNRRIGLNRTESAAIGPYAPASRGRSHTDAALPR